MKFMKLSKGTFESFIEIIIEVELFVKVSTGKLIEIREII